MNAKKILAFLLTNTLLLCLLASQIVFASPVDSASDFNYAAYTKSSFKCNSGSAFIDGNVYVSSGTFDLYSVTGAVNIKGKATLGNGVKTKGVLTGVTGGISYLEDSVFDAPTIEDIVFPIILNDAGEVTISSPSTVLKDTYYKKLALKNVLTIDVSKGDVTIVADVMDANAKGSIEIIGSGGVASIYIGSFANNFVYSSFNANGPADQLNLYTNGIASFYHVETHANLYSNNNVSLVKGTTFTGKIITSGTRVTLADNTLIQTMNGNIIAPNAAVLIHNNSTVNGYVLSDSIDVAANGRILKPAVDPPLPPPTYNLSWMRSGEVSDEVLIKGLGEDWSYLDAVQNTPLHYFSNEAIYLKAQTLAANSEEWLSQEAVFGNEHIWDNGGYYEKYKLENGNVAYEWASWNHFGGDNKEYSIRRFSSYLEITPEEYHNIQKAFLTSADELGNMSTLIPVNDTIFVYVNEELVFWGGTDVEAGNNQYHPLMRTAINSVDGIPLRSGINGVFKGVYPHTDGWCIDVEFYQEQVDISSFLKPGFNRIDVFTDDYFEGGGMNELHVFCK